MFSDIYRGKTVLVTGHTGFKGSWLAIWLNELGARVVGYALEPNTPEDNFVLSGIGRRITSIIGDVRDFEKLKRVFDEYRPEIVFHLAAQPLVRLSYQQPKLTYETNVSGTVNVLECCRLADSVKVIINITSDKCYENKEWHWGYRENDALGGHDPYSSSKACSEIVTAAYRSSFWSGLGKSGKYVSSVRAGNVIGGGDWSEDRLVPDCVKALKANRSIVIRSPRSVRPWQFVLEPLGGYLLLASKMYEGGDEYSGAWNFGPDHKSVITVEELVQLLIARWGAGTYETPPAGSPTGPHEAKALTLDISKAMSRLHWSPALDVAEAVWYTLAWYMDKHIDYEFCAQQIASFIQESHERIRLPK